MSDSMSLTDVTWEDYYSRPTTERAKFLNADGSEVHVLLAQQFGRERLDELGELATTIRRVAKNEDGAKYMTQTQYLHSAICLFFTRHGLHSSIINLAVLRDNKYICCNV